MKSFLLTHGILSLLPRQLGNNLLEYAAFCSRDAVCRI